jgi:hypothetical protein
VCAAFAAACASGPSPRDQIAAAESAMREAERADAQTYATAEWNNARETLADAKHAAEHDREVQARRLAELAEARAQLASARSREAQARRSLENQQESVDRLEAVPAPVTPPPAPLP